MIYQDRLYGKIVLEKVVEEMLSCSKIRRLEHISLSAVPKEFLAPFYFKDMASRLEHSIGMTHLVEILCGFRREFNEYKNALLLAAVCHDAGAPPFSHNGEHLLKEMTKMNHEQYIEHILKNSAAEEIIKKYGYSLKEIADIINGNGAIGKLMNNTIDIDNVDNTERYGFSSGLVKRISNHENIVKAFMLKDGNICVDGKYSKEIEKWKDCRKKIYNKIVYGDTNISAGSMLVRALGFLYEENKLKKGFFNMTDNEALEFMKENCNYARTLIERAEAGNLHSKAAEISSFEPSKNMMELCKDWRGRLEAADIISETFSLERTDVSVQAFRHKLERDVNFCSKKIKKDTKINQSKEIKYDMRVFINSSLTVDRKSVQKTIQELAGMQ